MIVIKNKFMSKKNNNNMNDESKNMDTPMNESNQALNESATNPTDGITTETVVSTPTEMNWKIVSYILTGIIILMALSAGGYYWYKHRSGVTAAPTSSQFVDDTAANALLNLGKDASVKNYREALTRIKLDDVVASIADSDIMWKSELVRQGQTDPKPEDVQKFKDYIKNTTSVYAQLTTSIKMSFLDAIQGDDDANVDLLALFKDLEDGKLPDSFKEGNGEATFAIPNRKEVWHMKKYDDGYKVYKIDITE